MSVTEGQRIVSLRRRMLAYCEQHHILVPASFHEQEAVYPIAVVDIFIAQKHRLVEQTFYNDKMVLQWLKDHNKHPANFRVLDFRRGAEYVLENDVRFIRGPAFDNRSDIDVKR